MRYTCLNTTLAAHILNLVASVDAKNASKMAKPVFAEFISLWRKQTQPVQASQTIKDSLGRLLFVPNATWWNSINSMKFINEVPKAKLDATFNALLLLKLQCEELLFVDEYCKICHKHFLHFVQCAQF